MFDVKVPNLSLGFLIAVSLKRGYSIFYMMSMIVTSESVMSHQVIKFIYLPRELEQHDVCVFDAEINVN